MKQTMIEKMKRTVVLLALLVGFTSPAMAELSLEEVRFDCTGELVQIIETAEGYRATGLVNLTVDLPNGAEWRSSGLVVIAVPAQAAERKVEGRTINRCIGTAQLQAEQTGTVNGVPLWTIRLNPTQVRLRIGNQRITDPSRLEFGSTAGGSPNI
jgi:hypothetical protein